MRISKKSYFIFLLIFSLLAGACSESSKSLSGIASGTVLSTVKSGTGWGLQVLQKGKLKLSQPNPFQIEIYTDSIHKQILKLPYESIEQSGKELIAKASVKANEAVFDVTDKWQVTDSILFCKRNVVVKGNASGGFLSSISFITASKYLRPQADIFVPGMIYGSTGHLSARSIGSIENFANGIGNAFIREDRMPAPLFGVSFNDGFKVSMLNPSPDGNTSLADAHDVTVKTLIDTAFRFGSMGVSIKPDTFLIGYKYPGSEGDITYTGNTYPGGQLKKWRNRYHPIAEGFTQNYAVAFRFSGENSFPEFYKNDWRWAWNTLNPKVNHQDINLVERSMLDMLADRVEEKNGKSGITNWMLANAGAPLQSDRKAIMGFTGKNIEAAYFLLLDGDSNAPTAKEHRKKGIDIINSFTKLKMSPPVGEGFNLDNGKPELALPSDKKMYLRSFGDDMKMLLKAIRYERKNGRDHADWLAWVQSFADWLVPQQYADGGFPRTWRPVTGEVVDSSAQASYNVVPMLTLLTELTGNQNYQKAAIKAAAYCWNSYLTNGCFVGGTIDNPDVVDKEAGTLSVEAYLSLYHATKDQVWVERAVAAANYAETWIYIWNVPMVPGEDDSTLGWKKGVPSVGLQLISTGHSLVDDYMAFDTDEFAFLYKATGDKHYFDVAKLLLHNTKSMVAVPGRLYDLRGPGWQQEHWSLAPLRGNGLHRGWLPWVTTSQLNGIQGLKELDENLYNELCQ